MPKAILPIPTELDDAWNDLRSKIMGNPNSVMNNTNDWVGWFMEGFNEAVWPQNPADAAAYGGMGLGPAVTTAIPKPFKSEWLERIKKYAPSFPKKATGAEILEQLEAKGILPKGYGEYYSPAPASALSPFERVKRLEQDLGRSVTQEEAMEFLGEQAKPISRDQLVPHLEENWVNPRIDVRSRSAFNSWKELPNTPENFEKYLRRRAPISGWTEDDIQYMLADPEGHMPQKMTMPTISERLKYEPKHSSYQTIFGDLADDSFELLVKPRRGLDIPVPEKLRAGGHWNDPSVMTHVRGEVVGPRAIVQEDQSDWNRIFQLKNLYETQKPFYYPGGDQWLPELAKHLGVKDPRDLRGTLPGYHIRTGISDAMHFDVEADAITKLQELSAGLGDVPPLPPELSKSWPETGAKAALSYAARQPNLQRVSFVDDLIAASVRNLDPERTAGIYGARLPQFLRKYVPKYGGEYRVEPLNVPYKSRFFYNEGIHDLQQLQDTNPEAFNRLYNTVPKESSFHTIELGDWNSPFRKFLRGQQPLAVAPTIPLGMGLFTGDEEYRDYQ